MSGTETQSQQRLADDAQMPRAGAIVGDRYEIQDVLGEGGFAVVYRAFDARTKGEVAVKVLDPIMSRRNEFASRFMREVETVSRLRHHNSISIFDAGETEQGCLYLVMELLEGKPLDTILEAGGALEYDRVKNIAAQILKSLQEAHSKGIIHRDLKPANVFLANLAGERDYVKVLDFGIAKSIDESQDTSLTATGQVMCSPHYVAPERIKEHLTVPASDIYSLGVMMVELLEGKPPYEADSPMMLAVKHLSAEPVPMGERTLSAPFASVIQRACEKSLDDRYETALEMLEDLTNEAAYLPPATPQPAPDTAMRPAPRTNTEPEALHSGMTGELVAEFSGGRSNRAALIGVLAFFLIAGGVAAFFIIQGAEPAADTPEEQVAAVTPPVETAPPQPPADPPPMVPVVDPAATVVTARALVGAALAEGRTGSILALREREQAEAAAQLAAIDAQANTPEPTERTDNRERERDNRDNRDDRAEEREAAEREAARQAAERAEAERLAAERAAAEREAAEREAAARAAEEEAAEEEEASRRRIRTNVAPRQ